MPKERLKPVPLQTSSLVILTSSWYLNYILFVNLWTSVWEVSFVRTTITWRDRRYFFLTGCCQRLRP